MTADERFSMVKRKINNKKQKSFITVVISWVDNNIHIIGAHRYLHKNNYYLFILLKWYYTHF